MMVKKVKNSRMKVAVYRGINLFEDEIDTIIKVLTKENTEEAKDVVAYMKRILSEAVELTKESDETC